MQKCELIILLIFFFMVQIVYGIYPICEDRLLNQSNCSMVTPSIPCNTYDILKVDNNTVIVDDGTLTLLNNSIYYFNFTENTGDYLITLCDNTTREFRVTETYDEKFNKEEDARMYIAIIIGMFVIIGLFAFLASHFHKKATIKVTEGELSDSKDLIKDANWFKAMEMFCILFIFFLIILLNNTARIIASDSGASSNILSMFDNLHIALIAATILFLALFMLRFLVLLVENFKREKLKKEMGEKGE